MESKGLITLLASMALVLVLVLSGCGPTAAPPAETATPSATTTPPPTPTLLEDKIAFDSDRDGNPEIYVMNADGSNQTRVTNNPTEDFIPAWSPDGKKIAFQSDRDGNTEIYVMNADGTNQTRVTNNPAGDTSPAWWRQSDYVETAEQYTLPPATTTSPPTTTAPPPTTTKEPSSQQKSDIAIFPDIAIFNEYFSEMWIAKVPPSDDPGQPRWDLRERDVSVFNANDWFEIHFTARKELTISGRFYSVSTEKMVCDISPKPTTVAAGSPPPNTMTFSCFGFLPPGRYEYRVYVNNDILVAIFPFELSATWTPTTTPPVGPFSGRITLNNGDSYHFLTQKVYKYSGGDFYFSLSSGKAMFWANNTGQMGLLALGNIGSMPLDQVAIPKAGYQRYGVEVVVGHTYVSPARGGEEGWYIVFRVSEVTGTSVTIEYLYRFQQ